ncbi:hypothetical protein [Roseovarius sp. D22-M7]|uniref:hypothetical protein n=1 Tax=Roseovarius sp. D22-M7 TaxID=3127116 RepID=UPI0030101606
MFAFKLGKWVGILAVILGLLRVAMGLFIAFGTEDLEAMELASRTFLGTKTSGEAVDQGTMAFVVGLVIWMIAEIGQRLEDSDDRK